MNPRLVVCVTMLCAAAPALPAELRVPATTAYLQPNTGGARVSAKSGVTGWRDPKVKVLWFGELKKAGDLTAAVLVRLPKGVTSKLRLSVGDQAREANVVGTDLDQPVTMSFGSYAVPAAGYRCFTLESLSPVPGVDVEALILDGPASEAAHFNLQSRRNAASVHLFYPTPDGAKSTGSTARSWPSPIPSPRSTWHAASGAATSACR